MHKSSFSYSLTRAYPYPWFSYVIWIGGLTALILFSIINLVANGYTTSIIFTNNPNATEQPDTPAWYQRTPWSLASKITSSCQPQTISIGSVIYTTNLGLAYTIQSMFAVKQNQSYPKVNVAYKNDAFHDCIATSITLRPDDTKSYLQFWMGAEVSCTVYISTEPTTVTMTTSFGCFEGGLGNVDLPSFIDLGRGTQSGLFWGQIIVGLQMVLLVEYLSPLYDGEWMFRDRTLRFLPLENGTLTLNNVEWDYYQSESVLLPGPSPPGDFNLTTDLWSSTFGQDMLERHWIVRRINNTLTTTFDLEYPFNSIVIYADGLIKATRAVILTDFGQSISSNPVTSPQKTLNFLNATLAFYQLTPHKRDAVLPWSVLTGIDTKCLFITRNSRMTWLLSTT